MSEQQVWTAAAQAAALPAAAPAAAAGAAANESGGSRHRSPDLRALALLLAILLGVAAGVLAIPFAFRHIPNDLSRIATVYAALRGQPAIVVFGDSRTEASVDAAQLSAELPGRPLAYSAAWHGQKFSQAFAIARRVPASVRIVVVSVSLQDLASPTPGEPRIWEAMRAYGWDPDPATLKTMREAFGGAVPAEITRSRVGAIVAARWGVRQLADTGLRALIRRDLRLDRERNDLFFPTAYTQRVAPAAFEGMLRVERTIIVGPTISDAKKHLLASLAGIARERHQQLVLLIPAAHSRMMIVDHERRMAELRAFAAQHGFGVIDASRWVADDDFIDPLHPSVNGARTFTSRLAAAMRGED